MAIASLVLGFLGMKDPAQKNLAIGGIALCAIGLILACINSAIGMYLGATGQGIELPQF